MNIINTINTLLAVSALAHKWYPNMVMVMQKNHQHMSLLVTRSFGSCPPDLSQVYQHAVAPGIQVERLHHDKHSSRAI